MMYFSLAYLGYVCWLITMLDRMRTRRIVSGLMWRRTLEVNRSWRRGIIPSTDELCRLDDLIRWHRGNQ